MRRAVLLASTLTLLAACGGRPDARTCVVDRDARPRVTFSWRVAHGSMDDDPPRARVKLAMTGAASGEVDLGELHGVCALVDLALPENPVGGAKVTELACAHGGKDMIAAVVYVQPGKLAVQRYERSAGAPLQNQRSLHELEVPSCASFSAELAQAGEL